MLRITLPWVEPAYRRQVSGNAVLGGVESPYRVYRFVSNKFFFDIKVILQS